MESLMLPPEVGDQQARSPSKTTVLVAGAHRLVLEGIAALLACDCQVVGTAITGRDVLELSARLNPDIVLLDVTMPVLSGIEVARQLKRLNEHLKIIFVTAQSNCDYVRAAFT